MARAPRDGLAAALPIVLVALLLVGGLAVVLAAVREREDVQKREEEATELVRSDVSATIDELVAALAGTSALVNATDEPVALPRWQRYAADAIDASIMVSLGFELVIDDSERAAFEALIEGPILDPLPDGSRAPAARRSSYLPVRDIVPMTEQNRAVVGFDIAADPTRHAAALTARDQGNVVISEPVNAQSTGRSAFFIVKALYRPDMILDSPEARASALVGYVTTAVAGQTVVDDALPRLPDGTRFSIEDRGVLLGSTERAPATDGQTSMLPIAGREWELVVDTGLGPNYALAWMIGLATLLLTASVAFVLRTRIQAQRQQTLDADRHARSADLAQSLAEARTTSAVAEAVQREAPPLLGAFNATVRTVDDSQQVLRMMIDEHLPPPLPRIKDLTIDDTTPAGRAVQSRRWILVPDVANSDDYQPEITNALLEAGYRAIACIPLEDVEGDVVGLLGVAWQQPKRFDETTMALLRTITELCEQTLERSRLHDSEHLLVQRLQLDALRPLPEFPRLEMSVHYESAVQTLAMGGDWYDTIVLDDERVALVVGDVAGHGVPAVAEMIELRSAIHALLRSQHHPIDQVLSVTDSILSGGGRTRIATALVAVFDSAAGCVQYASAGHPPAILRDPDGAVEVLMDGRRPVLGVPPATPCVVARRPFMKDWTFVAYTDGLIERRHEDLIESVDKLAATLSPPHLRGDQLADAILAAHAPTDVANDDVALVIVRGT